MPRGGAVHRCPQMYLVVADFTPRGGERKVGRYAMLSQDADVARTTFGVVARAIGIDVHEIKQVECLGAFVELDATTPS